MKFGYALVYNGWCIESVREVVTTSRSTLSSTVTCTHHGDQRRSRFTGQHTSESPVEPTGPNDTGSSTQTCSIDQLCNDMQRGSLPGSCSETRHTPLMPPDRHIMQHAHKLRSSRTQSCCRLRRHRRSSSSLHPPPGGPRPPGATKGIKAGAQPLPAHAPSSGSRAARCPCTRSRNRSRASMPANQPVIRGCTRAARAGDADRATCDGTRARGSNARRSARQGSEQLAQAQRHKGDRAHLRVKGKGRRD